LVWYIRIPFASSEEKTIGSKPSFEHRIRKSSGSVRDDLEQIQIILCVPTYLLHYS
jgi:hypothetical protein